MLSGTCHSNTFRVLINHSSFGLRPLQFLGDSVMNNSRHVFIQTVASAGSDSDGKLDKRNVHKQRMSAAERRAPKPKKDKVAIPKHDDKSDALRGYEMFHKL